MVGRVSWFSDIHYQILLHFEQFDTWLDPPSIAKGIGKNPRYTARKCRELLQAGLLERDGRIYCLSDDGRKLLKNELPTDVVEKRDPTDDD